MFQMMKIKVIFIRSVRPHDFPDMMNSLVVTVCLLASLTNAFQEVSSPEYIARTAAEKSEIIWSNVLVRNGVKK